MRIEIGGQPLGQYGWDIGPAIAAKAIGEDDLARRLDRRSAVELEVQAEIPPVRLDRRFDPPEASAVANWNSEETTVPAELLRPCLARNAFELGVGLLPVPFLVPGLNAKGRDAEFGSGQVLWRSQHIHSRGGQPDTRCLARRKINERDPADPGSPQRKPTCSRSVRLRL